MLGIQMHNRLDRQKVDSGANNSGFSPESRDRTGLEGQGSVYASNASRSVWSVERVFSEMKLAEGVITVGGGVGGGLGEVIGFGGQLGMFEVICL